MALPAQCDVDPQEHELELLSREASHSLGEKRAVERDDLRNVRDGVLGQSRDLPAEQEDVARRLGPGQVARERHANDGADPAPSP